MIILQLGDENQHKIEVDIYGSVKIRGIELSAEDIQIIATTANSERANYIKYARPHLKAIRYTVHKDIPQ